MYQMFHVSGSSVFFILCPTLHINLHFAKIIFQNIFESLHIAESRHQMQTMSSADNRGQSNATSHPVWPEDTDAQNSHNHLIFTDGETLPVYVDF